MKLSYMLDTETTGLNFNEGDRIIEIAVVEYNGMEETGKTYQTYINPGDKKINPEATAIHGITNEQLENEPSFEDIVDDFLEFINDGEIIIYNSGFDMGFINGELKAINREPLNNDIIDALAIARKKFPGGRNTLDNVAKKLNVDISQRQLHGALIDSVILGQVYCKLVRQDEFNVEENQNKNIINLNKINEKENILRVNVSSGTHLTRAETSYTLFSSALKPHRLVEIAKDHGYDSVCLTDKYTMAGAMAFADACKKNEIKGVVGVALDISGYNGKTLTFYATNEIGWKNIQKLITIRNVDNKGMGLTSKQLMEYPDGLVVTSGSIDGIIAQIYKLNGYEKANKSINFFKNLYHNNFALEINRNKSDIDHEVEAVLIKLANENNIPILASQICKAETGQEEMVEILKAIGNNDQYQPEYSNGEDIPNKDDYKKLFKDIPNALENCNWIIKKCDFLPSGKDPMLPKFETELNETEAQALDRLAMEGLTYHLKEVDENKHEEYMQRYKYESELINSQGFAGYFLIVADFIKWANEKNIPVGPGRGSGAGSIVAWSLGITKLDPIKMELLFERFINPERVSLPDFDIDFCEKRREEVIKYVRRKYGDDHVVAIGAYTTFQARGGIKDVGRVLGQPYGLMDRISKALPDKGEITDEILESNEIQSLINTPEAAETLRLGTMLHGLVRNKTRHAAGIIISDRPVSEVMALDLDPNDQNQSVTQYEMNPVEKAGLVKFDFLGLKTLTIIEKTKQNLLKMGIEIDPYKIDMNDQKTFKALSDGKTMGVFQLESPGITKSCREIKIDEFEDIVAIVALYRPGPMEYIPLYARRKKGLEPFATPHPLLDSVARNTYGILVYQEQVMQAARVLAGYSLGQADILRKAMGKKIKSEMDSQKEIFIKGCLEHNGIKRAKAVALFEIIEKFASYGFNRSHAAAYGLLSYITAYLANNYPAAYFAATMDGSSDDSDHLLRLAQEARKRNIKLLPPVIDGDAEFFKPIDDKTIRWSLSAIKGLGVTSVKNLVTEFKNGPPKSIKELIEKSGEKLNRTQAVKLAATGALDNLKEGNRKELILKMQTQYDALSIEAKAKKAGQIMMFNEEYEIDTSIENLIDDKEALEMERDALGLTLKSHPIDSYKNWMDAENIKTPTDSDLLLEYMPVRIAAQVDDIKTPKKGKGWLYIRLSDAETTLEVSCESNIDNIEILEKGSLYIFQISGFVKSGERKLRIDSIEKILGENDKESLVQTLKINAEDDFDRDALRKLISKNKDGNGRLRIIQHKNKTTTPLIVDINNELISDIEKIRGVLNVELTE